MKTMLLACTLVSLLIAFVYTMVFSQPHVSSFANTKTPTAEKKNVQEKKRKPLLQTHVLPAGKHVVQTYNNCGPATLSMIFSFYGKDTSQQELAERMRPFNNPFGGIDDKSIFADEFVAVAKEYGFEALQRPNGTSDLLKQFVAEGIPVIVRTWLATGEDIGHFRIIRGYNDMQHVFIQDDSYEGGNLQFAYDGFKNIWQPFNYGYILVYPKEKHGAVVAILGKEINERTAWENAKRRAEKEIAADPSAMYAWFNLATASYYLGDYTKAIDAYEKVAQQLPLRMLWYQIEPIYAYAKVGNTQRVFAITDQLLFGGNQAFSELYYLRGEIYQAKGQKDLARQEFESAVYYHKHFKPAKQALAKLTQ